MVSMEKIMKILFLDLDGVLNNTHDSIASESFMERTHYINQENLNNLKLLVDQENYQIIISSTWRKDKSFIEQAKTDEKIIGKFKDLFKEYGWENAPIIGITPNLSGFRGQEVATKLDNIHVENIDYLILDDDKDFILGSLLDMPIAKLDRLGIVSQEEALEKSAYWSHQNLYVVNAQKGLTKEDVENILNFKKNEISQSISKKMK